MTKARALLQRVSMLCSRISYPRGGYNIRTFGEREVYIQHMQTLPDCKTGKPSTQYGRKWYISQFMTDDEILRTFLLATRTFEEHEVYENFKVDGERYLNPHPEGPRPSIPEGPRPLQEK